MKILIVMILVFSLDLLAQHSGRSNELPPDCKRCHECDEPTKVEPCLKACPREHMITVHHSPEEGPDIIKIDEFRGYSDLYEEVIFSHRAHAEMSGMGGDCQICHHYNPPGNILPCNDCHELSRIRTDIHKPDLKAAYHRQCIDCHREWSGEVECVSCHAPEGKADKIKTDLVESSGGRTHPAIAEPTKLIYNTEFDDGDIVTFYHNEHTNLFGFECNACHRNESCSKCHMKAELRPTEVSTESKHMLCSGCHDTEDNCEYCHRTEELKPFDHKSRTGFDLKGFHSALNCIECHPKKGKFAGLNSDCSGCHANWSPENFNHGVTGIVLDETHSEFDCESCHLENFVDKPTCDMCHDEDISYPDSIPGKIKAN